MNEDAKPTNGNRRRLVLSGIGGVVSLVTLWVLASVEAFQPYLLAPLGLVNKASWALVQSKIIPDGSASTLFISCYFILAGVLAGFALGSLQRHATRV